MSLADLITNPLAQDPAYHLVPMILVPAIIVISHDRSDLGPHIA